MRFKIIKTMATIISILNITTLQAWTDLSTFIKYPNKYFIETGSYLGDGIQNAVNAGFKEIYSIELQDSYYEHCSSRFSFNPSVKIFLGSSSDILPLILKEIDAPATFWLDGHYSGPGTGKKDSNTPLLAELEHISQHPIKTHTILIDDIRLLEKEEMDFISLETIIKKIQSINPDYEFSFENGYTPKDVLVAIIPNKSK